VKVTNLEVSGCRLNSTDAPVVLLAGRTLELNSVNFTDNKHEAGSAALKMEIDSELVIENCLFNHNNGSWSTLNVTDGNTLTISSSTFINNTAYLGGGALRIEVCIGRDIILIVRCRANEGAQQLSLTKGVSLKTMKPLMVKVALSLQLGMSV